MSALQKTIQDSRSILEWVGRVVQWLVVPLTLLLVYEVVTRRIFNTPHIWTVTVATQIYALHFLCATAPRLSSGARMCEWTSWPSDCRPRRGRYSI